MSLVDESEALHQRVRAFARGASSESFEELALELASFQARWSPGYARLCSTRGGFSETSRIPAVPADAFRIARVAVHPPELDAVRFATSGTTSEARGVHALRTTQTYRELALGWGERGLGSSPPGGRVVVALAPDPGEPGESSLGFMLRLFMQHFDGRPRTSWLVGERGVDVEGLRVAAGEALQAGQPLLVLATSFALAALLDVLAGARIDAPAETVVMQTGGFKGRAKEVDAAALRIDVAQALGIAPERLVGEYGMTELTSQLYEGTLPGGALVGAPGVYLPPPWVRVSAVDPVSLEPVARGELGLAHFLDLGNVDSAVAVVTQDLVRARGAGVELIGRQAGAPARGCSLALEAFVRS